MRTAVSTVLRPERPASAAAVLDPLRQAGAASILIDATLPRELGDALLPEAVGIEHAGRPRLCSTERDERNAAVESAGETVRRAGGAGVPLMIVWLGAADVKWDPDAVALAFARDEWHPARLQGERAQVAPRHLDAARFALERLIPICEREAVKLAVAPRQTPVELPDAAELRALLGDFRGAPLGAWYDTAAAYRERLLELGTPEAWLALDPVGARAADACGLVAPLAPGLGEVDFTTIAKLPLAAIHAPADTSPAELAESIALLLKA